MADQEIENDAEVERAQRPILSSDTNETLSAAAGGGAAGAVAGVMTGALIGAGSVGAAVAFPMVGLVVGGLVAAGGSQWFKRHNRE